MMFYVCRMLLVFGWRMIILCLSHMIRTQKEVIHKKKKKKKKKKTYTYIRTYIYIYIYMSIHCPNSPSLLESFFWQSSNGFRAKSTLFKTQRDAIYGLCASFTDSLAVLHSPKIGCFSSCLSSVQRYCLPWVTQGVGQSLCPVDYRMENQIGQALNRIPF